MTKTLLSLASLSALTSMASAASTVTLAPLTVSSTAIQTDELKSTDSVEVYTAEDIEKAHVQNVYEFLNQQTSVIAMPSYGNPFTQKLDMRGYGISDGHQNIVITINGRRMNNIDSVPQLLSNITPASIETIEIIKSSGIVTGGDGANAGVINITTKKNSDKEITLYGGTYINNDGTTGIVEGPYGVRDGSFYVGHTSDLFTVSANGEVYKNDGMRTIDAKGNKDKSTLKQGGLDLTLTPIEELELRAGVSATRTEVIYGGSMTQAEFDENPFQQGTVDYGFGPLASSATEQKYSTNAFNLGLSYYINSSLSFNIDGFSEKKSSEYVTYDSIADYTYNSAKTSLDYSNDLLALSVGVDLFNGSRDSHANTYTVANSTDKESIAAFLMSEWYLGNSTLQAGYRYEKVSYRYNDNVATDLSQDNTLNGAELGYNYLISKEQSIFLNGTHSYQSPDIDRFFALTYPPPTYTPVVGFNGFIEPMEANSVTLGYNNIIASNKFKIAAYYIDLTNEIYFNPVTFANTNIDKSHKYGVDLYDKWLINSNWNIMFNYNYVQAIIDEEENFGTDLAGNHLPGVSDHNIKATISYLPNKYTTFSLTQLYRSEAYAINDFGNNFEQKQAAYKSTDISATFTKESYEVFAKINNLFNNKNGLWVQDDAIYPVNYAVSGLVGLKLKF